MRASVVLFILSLGCAFWFTSRRLPQREPAQTGAKLADKLTRDALEFFDLGLRDPQSGQYLDNLALRGPSDSLSSSAATGFGLVSLAVGDQLGVIENAAGKARHTLETLLGRTEFLSKRSKGGWFRHWYDIKTGAEPLSAEFRAGYSTIETALVVAGAVFAGHYFENQNPEVRKLSEALLLGVDWKSAVRDLNAGKIYMLIDGVTEEPSAVTDVFNEYIMVVCMGAQAEALRNERGPMTQFWERHFADPSGLPTRSRGGVAALTDTPVNFLSSFAIQYPIYLCADMSGNPAYKVHFANAAKVDREFFASFAPQTYFWGSGAGEVRYHSGQMIKAGYHADAVERNPYQIVSPSTIAGFLPVYPEGLPDLLSLYGDGRCVEHWQGLDLIWRCSLRDLNLKFDRIQTVDFAMMMMGLATQDERVGFKFFRRHAGGAKQVAPRAF